MVMSSDEIAAKRARIRELDAALAGLRDQYDRLLSTFQFDEAKALAAEIEAGERERRQMAAGLPPPTEPSPPMPYSVTRRRRR
jgi:hypothetical protein